MAGPPVGSLEGMCVVGMAHTSDSWEPGEAFPPGQAQKDGKDPPPVFARTLTVCAVTSVHK